MRYTELKAKIGQTAKQIIISECSLQSKNNINYSCPVTIHKKDTHSAQWYDNSNSLYCHDCGSWYDIIHHSQTKPDPYRYLMDLAGEVYQPKAFNKLKPVITSTSGAGLKYLQSRGITKETVDIFKVRADENKIYFNYATPEGVLVKIKKRAIYEKSFTAVKGGSEILYGMHLLKSQTILAICEGEIDALTLYQIAKESDRDNEILCCSLPNGAKSLSDACIENCKGWLDRFEEIWIVPDQDEAGKQFVVNAKERLVDYRLQIIELPDKDINDFYLNAERNPGNIFSYLKPLVPDLKGVEISTKITQAKITNGITSGYITHDYNDNGLKPGCVTIVTGKTGDGKTTYARQMILASAMQSIKSFIFIGESCAENELSKFARLCSNKGEIVSHYGCAGTIRYQPAVQAIERYKELYSSYVLMSDQQRIEYKPGKMFHSLLEQMKIMASHHDVKLFVLDNLMVLCEKQGNNVFTEQKQIILDLKSFAVANNTHVILIAHPKKGGGDQEISGAAEIQNSCDTILRYVRLNDETKEKFINKAPELANILERASAYVLTEKVRDDGHKRIAWLEWDAQKGALYDLSMLPMAEMYENKGYWTKNLSGGNYADTNY